MPRILNKIKNPQEEANNINVNFDRIALDLADRSGTFSTVASVPGGITISAGTAHSVELSVLDTQNIYQAGRLPVIPRIDVYIDNDLDGDWFYPAGANITGILKANCQVSVFNSRSVFNQSEGEKATSFITLTNFDFVSHTFYVYVDVYYVPAPEDGIATREQ